MGELGRVRPVQHLLVLAVEVDGNDLTSAAGVVGHVRLVLTADPSIRRVAVITQIDGGVLAIGAVGGAGVRSVIAAPEPQTPQSPPPSSPGGKALSLIRGDWR